MFSRTVYNAGRSVIHRNGRMCCIFQNPPKFCVQKCESSIYCLFVQRDPNQTIIKRFKHSKKKKGKIDDDDEHDDLENEEDIEVDEYMQTKGSKQIESKVNSLRLDSVTKSGFGVPRNKIEEAFYESKIRVNGKKVGKKSVQVAIGDEIDMITSRSVENPDLLIVNRILILSVNPIKDGFKLKLVRDKSLLIEDYKDS